MTKFKIGDLVTIDNYEDIYDGIFCIVGIDYLSEPVTKYKLDKPCRNLLWVYETNLRKYISLDDVQRFGKILVDERFYSVKNKELDKKNIFCYSNQKEDSDIEKVDIQIISYVKRYYYRKSVDGKVVEFSEVRI